MHRITTHGHEGMAQNPDTVSISHRWHSMPEPGRQDRPRERPATGNSPPARPRAPRSPANHCHCSPAAGSSCLGSQEPAVFRRRAKTAGSGYKQQRTGSARRCSALFRERLLLLDRCDTQAMATDIHFAGETVRVTVYEEPGQVAEAFRSAQGLPFRLTAEGGRGDVYVNPSRVAFWLVSEPRRELEPPPGRPEESPQPTKEQQPVTDIWGQPLRRKRRR